jgi:electron-transferring-flavoprotein dehydrogenase
MARTEEALPPREAMEFDCVIVGAGPSGLSAAIRLKQLAAAAGTEISVVVLEKGSEVGAHILSGAVIDPVGLNRLIPDWKEKGAPVDTPVTADKFLVLGPEGDMKLPNWPMPPLMNNHGNYIVSLGALCKWLGEQASELGVEIYPGFAATEVLYDESGALHGVATGDMGVGRDGKPKDSFVRGMELRGKYTFIGEGARGSLAKQLIAKFDLDKGHEPQKYGIGIKELWEVEAEKHSPVWCSTRSAGRSTTYRRRLVPLSLRRQPRLRRLRRPPELREPVSVAVRGIPALQDASRHRDVFEGGKRIAMAPAPSPRVAGSRCPISSSRAACCSAVRPASSTCRASRAATTPCCRAFRGRSGVRRHGQGPRSRPLDAYENRSATAIAQDLKRVRNVKPLWSRSARLARHRARRRRHVAEHDHSRRRLRLHAEARQADAQLRP